MNEYWDEVDAILAELDPLIKSRAVHVSALHEVDAIREGRDPGLKSCPGCRAIILAKRLFEMHEARDDDTPQQRLGNKSRREVKVEEVKQRRERETPQAGAGNRP